MLLMLVVLLMIRHSLVVIRPPYWLSDAGRYRLPWRKRVVGLRLNKSQKEVLIKLYHDQCNSWIIHNYKYLIHDIGIYIYDRYLIIKQSHTQKTVAAGGNFTQLNPFLHGDS